MSKEQELFDTVYQWGKVGVVVDSSAPAFVTLVKDIEKLSEEKMLRRVMSRIDGHGFFGLMTHEYELKEVKELSNE